MRLRTGCELLRAPAAAGLALMGYPGLESIDPTFALPVTVVERLRGAR